MYIGSLEFAEAAIRLSLCAELAAPLNLHGQSYHSASLSGTEAPSPLCFGVLARKAMSFSTTTHVSEF